MDEFHKFQVAILVNVNSTYRTYDSIPNCSTSSTRPCRQVDFVTLFRFKMNPFMAGFLRSHESCICLTSSTSQSDLA